MARRPLCTECGNYDTLPDLKRCALCHARHLNPGPLGPIHHKDTNDPWF